MNCGGTQEWIEHLVDACNRAILLLCHVFGPCWEGLAVLAQGWDLLEREREREEEARDAQIARACLNNVSCVQYDSVRDEATDAQIADDCSSVRSRFQVGVA